MSIRLSTNQLRYHLDKVAGPRLKTLSLARNYCVASAIPQTRPLARPSRSQGTKCSRQYVQRTSALPSSIVPQKTMQMQRSYSARPSNEGGEPTIHDVFESNTGTWQYIVADPSTLKAIIIDPVLDYDPATQTIETHSADNLISLAKKNNYKIEMILETHAHADHITAASYLQSRIARDMGYKPLIGIGKRIGQVQELFAQRYGVPLEEYQNVYDILFDDDEVFKIGEVTAQAIHLPGHTPDHLGYKIGDNVFCGDSLFHVDIGTARCDFPGGSATNLFNSGQKLLQLPDNVKIWTGHDYPPDGRDQPVPCVSVEGHKKNNAHIKDGVTEQEFVAMRTERDAKLAAPRLLHQSLQMNIRAGRLPNKTTAGFRLLHLPLKLNGVEW
ncbi:metallo-beta-lactamase domain protein, putative [Talaromyces stipitatus ATCC 10500]|uniref:Metallo-beta-lactamase domain protein, putative n=1 Tax=Talaromyces stipitatus (strain ATCC 10500 / CBS 375.48 / QM 6759 / NRRL 1006) TaxID=441959 RepID=B8MT62_TALSN|nr:metallo-beta-lactamase domain protein, putative [Talaromyces stipitatus ATCC 10500]EED12159.1 metallo-beta-lactamase domain protein, putative [Talaromyces stipitatus ATCC 10500]